jgi:hypothetical protein
MEASSNASGGGKNEAPATGAQPTDAANTIEDFQYHAGPTRNIALWNEGPKIRTSQPEPRELQKAAGLPAIKKSICR